MAISNSILNNNANIPANTIKLEPASPQKQPYDAIELDLSSKDPKQREAEILAVRGKNALNNGDLAKAQIFFKQSLAIRPNYIPAIFFMAMIMDMRGHYGDAVKLYEKIIQCSDKPGFVSAAKKNMGQIFFAMGNFNYKKEDYAAALFYYAKATTADPNFAEAWNNKGVAHLKLNQYQEAIESLDKAIKLNCDEALSNKDIAIRLKEISEGIYSSTIVPMP